MKGTVLYGINNIFAVESGDRVFRCRLKGKILKQYSNAYNPLACGDTVLFEPAEGSQDEGLIISREARSSWFARWNKKGKAVQVIAANADIIVCVSSPASPPFRPRFIDRVLIAAENGNVEPIIVLNKCDLSETDEVRERMEVFKNLGYRILRTSAKTGLGLDDLKRAIEGKSAAFVGQSGVGKSSLLNLLNPQMNQAVRDISFKYDRGTHTTCYAVLARLNDGSKIIDTPGIREIDLHGISPQALQHFFPDFRQFQHDCGFPMCSHTHEPYCAVREAVELHAIHEDRYESYLRILSELDAAEKVYHD